MTQAQFEQVFADRRAEYRQECEKIYKACKEQIKQVKDKFHSGNAALEELRLQTIERNTMCKTKSSFYWYKSKLHKLNEELKSDYIDLENASIEFAYDCETKQVVFSITAPFRTSETLKTEN